MSAKKHALAYHHVCKLDQVSMTEVQHARMHDSMITMQYLQSVALQSVATLCYAQGPAPELVSRGNSMPLASLLVETIS